MKIVLCNGVFDLLHVAHIRHLREAREMGDILFVGLTSDEAATMEKRKPINSESDRREMLLALHCVSDVFVCDSSIHAIKTVNPQIFVKGDDYRIKGLLPEELRLCMEKGIVIRHTHPNSQTTSQIIERIKCA